MIQSRRRTAGKPLCELAHVRAKQACCNLEHQRNNRQGPNHVKTCGKPAAGRSEEDCLFWGKESRRLRFFSISAQDRSRGVLRVQGFA